jgi:hypothetical protein
MVTCPDCGRQFKTPQGLAGHARFKHKHPGKKRWIPGPGSQLITEGDFFKLLNDAIKASTETKEALYELIDTNTRGLQQLAELNHKHIMEIDNGKTELFEKQAELTRLFLNHVQQTKEQFAELTAIVNDLKDLIAVDYDKEKARA